MPKSNKPKPGSGKTAKRREDLRRNLPKPTAGIRQLLQKPEYLNAGLILLAFIVVSAFLVTWSREQVKVRPGQIMTETRVNRLDFKVKDEDETAGRRDDARNSAPRIYRRNNAYFTDFEAALNALPAVAATASLEEMSPDIVSSFRLTESGLAALKTIVEDEKATANWKRWVEQLAHDQLRRHPILDVAEYQTYLMTAPANRAVVRSDGQLEQPIRGEAIKVFTSDDGERDPRLEEAVIDAGFPPEFMPFVLARLESDRQPTFRYDEEKTLALKEELADAVPDVLDEHKAGEVIYGRGDTLDPKQYKDLLTEESRFAEAAAPHRIWLPRLGAAGLVAILLLFAGGFVALTYPRIIRNVLRITAIVVLMLGMLAVGVVLTTQVPALLYPAAVVSTLFVSIILLLSYDRRLALFLGTVQCALLALSLQQGVGWLVLLMAGCGTIIGMLREVRQRSSLIRAAMTTAVVLATGTVLLGLLTYPPTEGVWLMIGGHAAGAFAASAIIGFLVLGILPSIERLFDITTGMTLAELRDHSQTLLRQLQQRAAGTYNHSLQVANIAEAAADAIGADSLLVYVGALYHDIGKMNKPEYFIENQSGGFNKHTKLRPAMSLLVIIGHVKDGIELAREYAPPRSIQHFIESHHGTTLVEYFYHAAKSQAETDEKASVEEVEFRYPGPKPQSKEAAILMLADAVESATRAMTEPNPSRIESLVRELSRKRLLDGQFDECDLTFRELGLIEDAAIARLCAIHHGRISYPAPKTEEIAESA